MGKKGVTPIIATVLLIAIVMVISVIIYLWAQGFVQEVPQKFGRNVDFSCNDIDFDAGIFGNDLEILNNGNVPLYGFNIKLLGEGRIDVNDIAGVTIPQGGSYVIDLTAKQINPVVGDEFLIIPIILGELHGDKIAHTCDDQFGFDVIAE